jgi:hypothetical protein
LTLSGPSTKICLSPTALRSTPLEDLMRPFTAALSLGLGLALTLAAGCGGTRIRDKDGSVQVEPEPEPEPEPPAPGSGDPDAGAPGGPADPDGPAGNPTDPDGAAPPAAPDGPPPPPVDTAPPPPPVPPPSSCGGVTCPALFQLVHDCRPMGGCMLNALVPLPITYCYANGVKVVGESIVPPNLVGLVKRLDGTDCYRARIFQNAGSAERSVVWETPAGVPVATGVFDAAGNGTITCDAVTAPLADPSCVAVPSPQGCTPGFCL